MMAGELLNVTPPTAEPIDVLDAKAQLRIDVATEDALIKTYIAAARSYVEAVTGHRCVASTWSLTMANWPGNEIILPGYPLIEVDSVTYVDSDGTTQTAATTVYDVDTKRRPGRIMLGYNQSWPTTRGHDQDVIVTYKAGHLAPVASTFASDLLTFTGRTLADADIVRLTNGIDDLPAPLALRTDYHVRDQSGSTCKLAATAGGAAITLTDDGTGSHFIGTMPDSFYHAMRLLVGNWFENREPVALGTISTNIDYTVDALIWPERLICSI